MLVDDLTMHAVTGSCPFWFYIGLYMTNTTKNGGVEYKNDGQRIEIPRSTDFYISPYSPMYR
uniref:Uncharacterized protein n=1 Tax=Arundo donax TaxID=35708 RepID=A0A0A9H2S0_ARUDO